MGDMYDAKMQSLITVKQLLHALHSWTRSQDTWGTDPAFSNLKRASYNPQAKTHGLGFEGTDPSFSISFHTRMSLSYLLTLHFIDPTTGKFSLTVAGDRKGRNRWGEEERKTLSRERIQCGSGKKPQQHKSTYKTLQT